MAIRTHKRDFEALSTLGIFAWVVLFDKFYFFPLHSHSDLEFQLIGEFLELLALAAILFLMPKVMPTVWSSESTALTFRSRFAMGGCLASLMFMMSWRDFFPNDRFSLEAGRMDFLYGPAFAFMVVAISYVAGPRHPKLGNEEGKPVT